jgi:PiT family inorganic phosphate transporter
MPVPAWAVWAALLGFAAGMAVGGAKVARTVGFGLYRVRAGDALAAQFAAGLTVVAAAALGSPVSSGQTATAALLAAGAARRLSLPRWSLVSRIGLAWLITLPLSAALAAAMAKLATL